MQMDVKGIDLQQVKQEVHYGIQECGKRRLFQPTKWLTELNHGLREVSLLADIKSDP